MNTWADGFGRWHVRVPRNCVSPVIAARRGLRDELLARQSDVRRSIWMNPVRVPEYDTSDTIVYREGE